MKAKRLLGTIAVLAVFGLGGPAVAKNTGYIFVSSEKDNSISVLDGKSYALVKRIRTAARPRHLQFNADRTLIYAACGDGDAIDIIDVGKLELVDRILGFDDPEALDLSPDGKTMYVSLEDDAALGILDLAAFFAARAAKPELTVGAPSADEADDDEEAENDEDEDGAMPGLATVAVGEEPEGVLVSPDGRTVYVTSEVANMVHVIDVETRAIRANVVVGNRPRRFAMTADRKELWVSNELSGSVTILDVATNGIIDTIEFRPRGFRPEEVTPVGITMTADGKTAIVALGRANHVAFVNIPSRKIEDYVLVGVRAWNTTLNRDNSLLFVVNGLSDDISIIDVADRKVIKSVPVGRVPYAAIIDD